MICHPCDGTGFRNAEQLPDGLLDRGTEAVLGWIADDANQPHDVAICTCCGNGDEWHCDPGEHAPSQFGPNGPYAYNGGLPECA